MQKKTSVQINELEELRSDVRL